MFNLFTESYKSVFKVGSLNYLLNKIKQKLGMDLDNLKSGITNNNILETDMYGKGLGCVVSIILFLNNLLVLYKFETEQQHCLKL